MKVSCLKKHIFVEPYFPLAILFNTHFTVAPVSLTFIHYLKFSLHVKSYRFIREGSEKEIPLHTNISRKLPWD